MSAKARNPFDELTAEPTWELAQPASQTLHGLPVVSFKTRPDNRKRGPILHIRNLPVTTQESLVDISSRLGVTLAEVVRYFLEVGLADVRQGGLHLKPEIQPGGLTLYPPVWGQDGKAQRSKRKGRGKRSAKEKQGLAVRGVPDETNQHLKNLAEANGVPLWQVQRRLLEHGIERLQSGSLQVSVYAANPTFTLFPE